MIRTVVFISLILGIVASILLGIFSNGGNNKVLFEAYKLVLTFTLIGVFGALVKAAIDITISKQKEESCRYEEWEKNRSDIIREFTDIYSKFYSLRKLYHSARSSKNQIYKIGTEEYETLIRNCLNDAINLEGRYGGIKVSIIHHFNLPSGSYGYKTIDELINQKLAAQDKKHETRCSLDILGESFDDWRHALEQERKIEVSDNIWSTYEEILDFIESSKFQINANKRIQNGKSIA